MLYSYNVENKTKQNKTTFGKNVDESPKMLNEGSQALKHT